MLLAQYLIPFLMAAPAGAPAPAGTVERIKVHGRALEANLEGDSPDRDVAVYLPPSYKTAKNRRYPVVYFLHGFTDSVEKWFFAEKHWINLPKVLDKSLAQQQVREMIVVMPDAFTRFQGSMYSSSATTGDWETYVTRELVAYIDAHYRTLAKPESRGLAGHSMGGYGTLRLGMKYPQVFSSIYALSPCCLGATMRAGRTAEQVKDDEEIAKADFFTKATLASAAAWSPNPKKPPFFIDLPTANGEQQTAVLAKWNANAPLVMIDQYIFNLKRLKAIAFDAGAQDNMIAATVRTLDQILNDYGVARQFEIYPGDHINHVADRIETKVMPFFSKNLQ